MDGFVTSLHDRKKKLGIASVGGSSIGDIAIGTTFLKGIQMVAPGIGTGKDYVCPLYAAANKVIKLFREDKGEMLEVNREATLFQSPLNYKELFQFDTEHMVTFSRSKEVPVQVPMEVDFIKSNAGFFGVRMRMRHEEDPRSSLEIDSPDLIWLCGPRSDKYEQFFGDAAYQKRREIFGKLYDTAMATDPVKMGNPLYGPDGLKYIYRGKMP